MGEWTKPLGYIYTVEYYLALRKDEIEPFATTWQDLEGIGLNKSTEKDKNHTISLTCEI